MAEMTHRDRTFLEASVRCEVVLAALPSLNTAIGAMDATGRTDLSRLLKVAETALWDLRARFVVGQ